MWSWINCSKFGLVGLAWLSSFHTFTNHKHRTPPTNEAEDEIETKWKHSTIRQRITRFTRCLISLKWCSTCLPQNISHNRRHLTHFSFFIFGRQVLALGRPIKFFTITRTHRRWWFPTEERPTERKTEMKRKKKKISPLVGDCHVVKRSHVAPHQQIEFRCEMRMREK